MSDPNYFEQLVSLMNEEDLIRFRKRGQMQDMIVLSTILALEFERREALEHHGKQ